MPSLLTLLFSLSTLFLLSGAEAGHGGRVQVSLEDPHRGDALPTVWHEGDRFVIGEQQQRYAIRLANTTPRRLLVVLSVDGINAVTGETAAPTQRGYVLGPYQHTVVRGWRKSLDEVAEFQFAALPHSYAARTGRPEHVGVIGIAVFEERVEVPPPAPLLELGEGRRQALPAAPASGRSKALTDSAERESLGTAHGARRHDPVRQVSFERASRRPAEHARLYYDSATNLIAAGILPPPARPRGRRADPFPLGFVPDP